MKHLVLIVLGALMYSGCGNSDDINNDNPNIPDYTFDTGLLINTNLPQYSNLLLAGNYITVVNGGFGVNGFVLYYAGNNLYSAFELTDPNHQFRNCSNLTVTGIHVTCNCEDENTYEILNGLPVEGTVGEYPLKRYFVEVNGNIIRVFNN